MTTTAQQAFLKRMGKRIKAKRQGLEMTRAELARASDASKPTIQKVEDGASNVTILVLTRIAAALQCEVADLIC